LDDRPVSQHISRKVDFVPCSIDQRHVHTLGIFGRRIVEGRIGAGWREKGEKRRGQN
jgi:hypothetical protein